MRVKLAKLLIDRGDFVEAKHEISRVIAYKEKEGIKIPAEIDQIATQPWYTDVRLSPSNNHYYKSNIAEAETLLFSQLPWIAGNVGEVFSVPGKEDKPRRKLFLKTASEPKKVTIPESKFEFPDAAAGDAIRIKGEADSKERFQVYVVDKRNPGEPWDVFVERIGVVDHINKQKQLIHFIVDRKVDGVIPFSDLTATFVEGDAIAIKLSKYISKQGTRFRVLKANQTNKEPDSSIRKNFQDNVRVNNGMGFTTTDVFIPPPVVSENGIEDNDTVSGVALLHYNKKRDSWGWKAISAVKK